MARNYTPLNSVPLQKGVGFAQPMQNLAVRVTPDSPALEVMTDLTKTSAVIVTAGESVDEAHKRMRQRGVRLLLVVDEARLVTGIVTATDVLGEKPMQVSQARGARHSEVTVGESQNAELNVPVTKALRPTPLEGRLHSWDAY